MNKILWPTIILVYPYVIAAQTPIDSLRDKISSALHQGDSNKIPYYVAQIAWEYQTSGKLDSAIFYHAQVIKSQHVSEELKGTSYNSLGNLYHQTNEPLLSFRNYYDAYEVFNRNNLTQHLTTAASNLAIAYRDLGLHDEALSILFSMLAKLEGQEPSRELRSCYNTIGSVYQQIKSYDQALVYRRKALGIAMRLSFSDGIAQSHNNLGELFILLSQYDSAENHLSAAEVLKRSSSDRVSYARTLCRLGYAELRNDQVHAAFRHLLEAQRLQKEIGDSFGLAETLLYVSEVELAQGELAKATVAAQKASQHAISAKNRSVQMTLLKLQIKLALAKVDYKSAFTIQQLLIAASDSVYDAEKTRSLLAHEIRFETQKKQKMIESLEERKRITEGELRYQNIVIRVMFLLALLLLIIIALIYFLFTNAKSSKVRIQLLMDEMHHRMKNNLQMLSSIFTLQYLHLTDQSGALQVQAAKGRIDAMGTLHRHLRQSDEKAVSVNIKEYLTELSSNLITAYADNNIEFRVDIDAIHVEGSKAISIGLIVNELITNSLKYAFGSKPVLRLSLAVKNNYEGIFIRIEDNGHGIPSNAKESFGLSMIRTLVEELHGKLHFEADNGTFILITIEKFKL